MCTCVWGSHVVSQANELKKQHESQFGIKYIPVVLLAVVISTLASHHLDAASMGVKTLGHVQAGFAPPAAPTMRLNMVSNTLSAALTMGILNFIVCVCICVCVCVCVCVCLFVCVCVCFAFNHFWTGKLEQVISEGVFVMRLRVVVVE